MIIKLYIPIIVFFYFLLNVFRWSIGLLRNYISQNIQIDEYVRKPKLSVKLYIVVPYNYSKQIYMIISEIKICFNVITRLNTKSACNIYAMTCTQALSWPWKSNVTRISHMLMRNKRTQLVRHKNYTNFILLQYKVVWNYLFCC